MKRTLTACALLVCIVVSIDAATVSRHGVSIQYDPGAFSEVFYNEWVRSPRPRRYVSQQPGEHFKPGDLSFVFKGPPPVGSVIVSLTPTSHRSADYFKETYPHASAEIRKLKELLRGRPANPEIGASGERIHPVSEHSAFLVSKVQYFDFSWGSAIGFLHFSAQDEGAAAGFDPQFGWTRLLGTGSMGSRQTTSSMSPGAWTSCILSWSGARTNDSRSNLLSAPNMSRICSEPVG